MRALVDVLRDHCPAYGAGLEVRLGGLPGIGASIEFLADGKLRMKLSSIIDIALRRVRLVLLTALDEAAL